MSTYSQLTGYLKDNPKGYWFKARLYGWGWVPAKKEGWIVLLGYMLIVILAGLFAEKFNQSEEEFLIWYLPLIVFATIILIWICYQKGEKPRWMWGVPEKYKRQHF